MFSKQTLILAMLIVTAVVAYMIVRPYKAVTDIGNPTIKQGQPSTVSVVEGVVANVSKAWGSLFGKKGEPAVIDASQKAIDEAPYYA